MPTYDVALLELEGRLLKLAAKWRQQGDDAFRVKDAKRLYEHADEVERAIRGR